MGMHVKNVNIQQKMHDLLKKYNLVYNETTGLYDCYGDVEVDENLVSPDGKFLIKFGVVKGDFNCSDNKLTTLDGAPQEVGGNFDCSVNKLTSLKGAPQEVGKDFICYENQLTSLEGVPQIIDGDFYCSYNKLTSLKGAPQKVGGNFYCDNNDNLVFDETHFYGCLPDAIGGKLVAGDDCDYELAKEYYDPR